MSGNLSTPGDVASAPGRQTRTGRSADADGVRGKWQQSAFGGSRLRAYWLSNPGKVMLIATVLAVEVGVHRWDVESVLGEHAPIPADLAVQEVENVFSNFVPRLAGSGVADIGGAVFLRATDTPAAWIAQVSDGRLATQRVPDDPSGAAVVVTGAAQDIALLIWKRALPPRPELDVTGSVDVLKRFLVTDYIPDPRTTPAH